MVVRRLRNGSTRWLVARVVISLSLITAAVLIGFRPGVGGHGEALLGWVAAYWLGQIDPKPPGV